MRRRLDSYRRSRPWPSKDPAWRSELVRYEHQLILAVETLDLDAPERSTRPLDPATRAALEDRLALAGLEALAPAHQATGNVAKGGDLDLE